jgi:hypothetical protein
MAYDKPQANEWVRPVMEGYKLACCDCGLVHELDFKVVTSSDHGREYESAELEEYLKPHFRVEFRVRRNNRSTAAMRRKK